MSGSLNKVSLIGNLGNDPEVRSTQSGSTIVTLSIATSESWKDKQSGERRERTEWHRVVIFNEGLAGVAEKFLRKGASVYVEGKLATKKWTDKDGIERWSTEIQLTPYSGVLTMLGAKKDSAGARGETRDAAAGGSTGPGFSTSDSDDEIPFAKSWQ